MLLEEEQQKLNECIVSKEIEHLVDVHKSTFHINTVDNRTNAMFLINSLSGVTMDYVVIGFDTDKEQKWFKDEDIKQYLIDIMSSIGSKGIDYTFGRSKQRILFGKYISMYILQTFGDYID